jgi:hypothetical protein
MKNNPFNRMGTFITSSVIAAARSLSIRSASSPIVAPHLRLVPRMRPVIFASPRPSPAQCFFPSVTYHDRAKCGSKLILVLDKPNGTAQHDRNSDARCVRWRRMEVLVAFAAGCLAGYLIRALLSHLRRFRASRRVKPYDFRDPLMETMRIWDETRQTVPAETSGKEPNDIAA